MSLRTQLQQLFKGGSTMSQYLGKLKDVTNALAAIGEPVSYRDHLGYLLEGLLVEYDAFVSSVYNRANKPNIEKIKSLLMAYD